MSVEHMSTLISTYGGRLKNRVKAPHTIAVVGSSRGGTSCVAYAMVKAGIYMGKTGELNHEDTEILPVLHNKHKFRQIIRDRNSNFRTWGFKIPEAAFHLDWLDGELRNPIFVYVTRNIACVAASIMKRDPIYGPGVPGLAGSLTHALRYYTHMIETLRRLEAPMLMVQYEAILRSPEKFCAEFFSALEIPCDDELTAEIVQGISSPGYKSIKPAAE